LAPVAMQQGTYVANRISSRLTSGETPEPPPFRYRDRGSMAVIGRYSAVAVVGQRQWSGLWAWFIWLFIHLMEITQFRNRILVMLQWGWTYLTHDRAARLITGPVTTAELNASGPPTPPVNPPEEQAVTQHPR